ncbi:hypothetical protein BJ138DRAFT_1097128 [Hygrophoropsis aurantiaca]|uniref:Uncharacterized protein n=1 Tax=Hygrophoropsis aurantiaca TaxID=72124 RepID=A0ACB8ASR5_9AGAM|nr:hypothetical protein BJ138DRAFT_1097128 [Hygrophoropsis aurantiaca]
MRSTTRSTRSTRSAKAPGSDAKENSAACTISTIPIYSPKFDSEGRQSQPLSGRKFRHRMTPGQLERLEECFEQNTHPSRDKKKEVAAELMMDIKTVNIWFQNKRQAAKKSQPKLALTSMLQSEEPVAKLVIDEHISGYSSLRNVSSPSTNTTLATIAGNSLASEAVRPSNPVAKNLRAIAPKKSSNVALKPLTYIRIRFTPKPKNNQVMSEVTPRELWEHLSSSPPVSERSLKTTETLGDDSTNTASDDTKQRDKRLRTLEWACDRQAKRRKASPSEGKGHGEIVSPSTVAVSSDQDTDPALSLLALAAGRECKKGTTVSRDVMHGASLLLCFKNSIRKPKRLPA